MAVTPPKRIERSRPRAQLLLAGAVIVLAVATAIATLAAALGAGSGDSARGEGPYRGSEPPAGIELPEFSLTSYRGHTISSSSLRGRVVVLTLLDSQCEDACPILASVIGGAIGRLTPGERQRVRAVAITVDPAEDTTASVRRFLRTRRAEGRLDYLLGSERELRPLWQALQILPSLDTGRDELHSAPARIYGPDSVWLSTLHVGADLNEDNLVHDIRHALAAGSDDSQ